MSAEMQLLEAAVQLRAHAPTAWDQFLSAMDAIAAKAADECVSSPVAGLQVAQGRAQALRHTAQALHQAPEVYRRLQDKAKTRG